MKTKISTVYFGVAVVLSLLTVIDLLALSFPERFSYGPVLLSEKLNEKPDMYVPLSSPDPYLLQALSNPGKEVYIGSWEKTGFDEMVEAYGTNNAEFHGSYCVVHLLNADAFAYGTYFWLLLISWSALGISIIAQHMRRILSRSSV